MGSIAPSPEFTDTHYKDFEPCFCWNDKTDSPKRWLICPIDGLRYYYNP